MSPRTCAVIVNYRNAGDTRICLTSLAKSATRVRPVVVDNSPSDPGLDSVAETFPGTYLIRPDANLGFSGGVNAGVDYVLRNVDCEFIFLLNNDTTVSPDAVEIMEYVMDGKPDAGIVACRVVFIDSPGLLYYGGGDISWRRGGARVPGFGKEATAVLALKPREVEFASGCAMLVRKTVFERVGGFDPAYFLYEEDVDFCLRVRKAGLTIFYCPEALVRHKGHGSQRNGTASFVSRWSPDNVNYDYQVFLAVRNSVFNARKHARGWSLFEFVLLYPLTLFLRAGSAVRQRGLKAFTPVFRGLWAGLREPIGKSVTNRNTAA